MAAAAAAVASLSRLLQQRIGTCAVPLSGALVPDSYPPLWPAPIAYFPLTEVRSAPRCYSPFATARLLQPAATARCYSPLLQPNFYPVAHDHKTADAHVGCFVVTSGEEGGEGET